MNHNLRSEASALEEGGERPVRPVDAHQEDAYWSRHYWRERYYRPDCEYEDYAPAYCAGYVGWAQYGGSYDEAEKSLCANWERIKGDSRLSLDEARLAMRAAWDHAGRMAARPLRWPLRPRQVLGTSIAATAA
jgi:hypothetical protein